MATESSEFQLQLRERDLAEQFKNLNCALTETEIAIYRAAWHAGFASGLEVAKDVVTQTFKEKRL